MYAGFLLAAYSVVGNDVIQTLGTFLSSNKDRPWWILWLFAGGILTTVLIIGYLGIGDFLGGDDVAFDRLDKLFNPPNGEASTIPSELSIWYLLPPIILLVITRFGIPVSTTFLILSFFSIKSLPGMLQKSLMGYAVAILFAVLVYMLISRLLESQFIKRPMGSDNTLLTNMNFWVAAQWLSTGFLWSQWLTQDLANMYIYLGNPEELGPGTFVFSLIVFLGLLAYIFYNRGGAIQQIVLSKTNTTDIRSATFIDLIYGIVLLVFKNNILGLWDAKLPMSTTWVFLGLLAGRELAVRIRLGPKPDRGLLKMLSSDLGKAFLGLIVSILLVLFLYWIEGRPMGALLDQ